MREANDEQQYREQTRRQASMPGVTSVTFMCRRCRQVRAVAGRAMRIVGWKQGGYVCAGYAAERAQR